MSSFDEQLGKLLEAAAEIGTKVIGVAVENGPQAMDMILWTYRYQGIATIAQGIACAAITFVLSRIFIWSYRNTQDSFDLIPAVACGLSGISFFIMLIWSVVNLFDKWAWAAAIDPKLYMAHVILSKIGG